MRASEAGYNMVVLIVAITVLNILVAAMLPLWSTQIRREKEEELIFRGLQYAEAIRVYFNQFGQYPTKLEDLLKVKPRKIRQLWTDPMTKDGKWQLIFDQGHEPFQGQPGQPPPNPGQPPSNQKGEQPTEEDENGRQPQFGPKEGETVQIGPIVGVRSRSNEKSMIVLFGKQRYNEWLFTKDVLLGGQAGPGQTPSNLQLTPTRWIGRPMRGVSNQPPVQDGTMPDGRPPGQNPRGDNRNRQQGPTKP